MRSVKEVEGRYVTKLCFQPDLTLILEDAEALRHGGLDERAVTAILSGTLVVQKEGGEALVIESVPGDKSYRKMDGLPTYRFIYESRIERCIVENDGTLIFEFKQGVLKVLPFDDVESWQMYNDKGFRLICMPGGEVAVWSEDSLKIMPDGDGATE
ncbi:MAG: hypothetical protein KatS3mg042_0544 [Rhodothermaceae bacterium]|nr:MAG: hypothetical protein KatS3mg042_0544 [Rhodothermaceae bacterium]